MTILIALIIIAVLILFHETGHFIAARRVGIPVHEFAIGFGPKLISWKRNGVEYSIRVFPLGGFVRMAGEEPGDQSHPDGYSHRTPLEKIRVSFAGPFMNFVLALLIFIYSYTFIGIPQATDEPIIGMVFEGQPAEAAGMLPGDRILAVDGVQVKNWQEFTSRLTEQAPGTPVILELERDGQQQQLEVITEENPNTGLSIIGVSSQVIYEKQGLLTAVKIGLQQTYELTLVLLGGLWIMITGGASAADIAGPVGIVGLIGDAARVGTVFLLSFSAFLSINLGILNLLPIPALDGSRILFALVEAVRRKPVAPEKEGFIHWLGFLFLMLLIVLVTFNDIMRFFRG
ncbi:MAG: RIP metalloprotease RseP [Syntrophomonadaceae bacterium]|jgi:regulator of sigma E protease|nr:RIP metalloprotease RseP [Syntrophomonadaceae bacterium]